MSVEEMKFKVHQLVDKKENEAILQKILELFECTDKKELSALEVFEKMAARYDNTLRKLAQ